MKKIQMLIILNLLIGILNASITETKYNCSKRGDSYDSDFTSLAIWPNIAPRIWTFLSPTDSIKLSESEFGCERRAFFLINTLCRKVAGCCYSSIYTGTLHLTYEADVPCATDTLRGWPFKGRVNCLVLSFDDYPKHCMRVDLNYNSLGATGLFLGFTQLRRLSLSGLGINVELATSIVTQVINATDAQLEVLTLSYNRIDLSSAESLYKQFAKLTQLDALNLEHNGKDARTSDTIKSGELALLKKESRLDAKSAMQLAESLKKMQYLKALILGNNYLGNQVVRVLGDNTLLEVLDLSYNSIDIEGLSEVAKKLVTLKELHLLHLQENNFEDKQAEELIQSILDACPDLLSTIL